MSVFHRKLTLASSSPRRQELLQQHGYDFDVVPPDEGAECGICSRETPPELVARLAYQKAANVISKVETGLIVACDTVAECYGTILGKPEDRHHAEQMLRRLSGKVHKVYSGLCIWDKSSGSRRVDVDVSTLQMEALTDQQLQDYLDSEQWLGKAGAFGFQDGLTWVHLISGSESNVVGLPMEMLAKNLASFA